MMSAFTSKRSLCFWVSDIPHEFQARENNTKINEDKRKGNEIDKGFGQGCHFLYIQRPKIVRLNRVTSSNSIAKNCEDCANRKKKIDNDHLGSQ